MPLLLGMGIAALNSTLLERAELRVIIEASLGSYNADEPLLGTVGQLSDGQNRVYGNLSPATYCVDSSGGISDSRSASHGSCLVDSGLIQS